VVSSATIALQSPALAADGTWQIEPLGDRSTCLEVQGASQANSAQVQLWTCGLPEPHRVWQFDLQTDGYYHIYNGNSGKCLNVQGGSMSNSAKVIQFSCQGYATTNDQWQPRLWSSTANGDFYRLYNRKSGKCLNVQGGGFADGTDLIQFDCSPVAQNNLFTWWNLAGG
jgi:hypothetical protein